MTTTKLTGTLFVDGNKVDMTKPQFTVKGTHCFEPDLNQVSVTLDFLPSVHHGVTLLSVSGAPGETPIDVEQQVWAGPDTKGGQSAVVSAAAWVSANKNRGSSHTLPTKGWVKFKKLEKLGPVEVELNLDFGKAGNVSGVLSIEKTEQIVCRSPGPPPSPPR